MFEFVLNHNLGGFFGFTWISQVMSAIIASERCFCVVSPVHTHHGRHHRLRLHRCTQPLLYSASTSWWLFDTGLFVCTTPPPTCTSRWSTGESFTTSTRSSPETGVIISVFSSHPYYLLSRSPLFFSSFNSSSLKMYDITASQRNYVCVNDRDDMLANTHPHHWIRFRIIDK